MINRTSAFIQKAKRALAVRLRAVVSGKSKAETYGDYSAAYPKVNRSKKKLVLAVQTGRSGMKWLCSIFAAHDNAYGRGERNRDAEAYYRYISWNRLPIDTAGILAVCQREILGDWKSVDLSLLSSPYFAYNFLYLYEGLSADRVIWAINDPVFTLTSIYNKGWYCEDYKKSDNRLALGFQPQLEGRWSHYFGRLVPHGDFFDEWKALTRVGKIAWYLNETTKEIHASMKRIPQDKIWVYRLEEADQNYDYYLRLADDFGLRPIISRDKFLSLKMKTAWRSENIQKEFNRREKKEFETYAADYIEIYRGLKGGRQGDL